MYVCNYRKKKKPNKYGSNQLKNFCVALKNFCVARPESTVTFIVIFYF